MKRALLSLIILCFALATGAKDKEVVIAFQYTRAQKMKIPEKTMEAKIQNVSFCTQNGDTQQALTIKNYLKSIVNEEYEHYVFCLSLHSTAQGTNVSIKAFDPFSEPADSLSSYFGVVKVDHCYFLIKNGQSQYSLLKSIFTKSKGKTNFVRVYELVQNTTEFHDTHVIATYNHNVMQASEMVICGDNKLSENN